VAERKGDRRELIQVRYFVQHDSAHVLNHRDVSRQAAVVCDLQYS